MNDMNGFEKLDQLKDDLKVFYFKIRDDIKDYHNYSWKNFAKDFTVCGLSSVSLATPLYALLESVLPKLVNSVPEIYQFFPDMGSDESISLRMWLALPLMFSGYIGDKLRTKSRKKMKEGSVGHHDGSFGSKMGFLTNLIPYGIKFGGDLVKAGIMTISSIPVSYASGMGEGFTTDFMKHVFLNEVSSKRIPSSLARLGRKAKLGLAGLMVATSISGTAGIYAISDCMTEKKEEKKEIKMGNLEKYSLERAFPEFHNFSILDYMPPADGLRVDTPKCIQK